MDEVDRAFRTISMLLIDLVLRLEVDISPSQLDTGGSINYILIGDVGQTKETELYKYFFNINLGDVKNLIVRLYGTEGT